MGNAIATTAEALNKALQTPPIQTELLAVANMHLEGYEVSDIAAHFNVSEERVVASLQNKRVQKYINGALLSNGYLNRKNRVDLLNKLVIDKIDEGSSKDITEIIKLLQAEDKALAEKAPSTQVTQNIKTDNIENLLTQIAEVK